MFSFPCGGEKREGEGKEGEEGGGRRGGEGTYFDSDAFNLDLLPHSQFQ